MIYFFSWNNHFLIRQEITRWKQWYIQKHGTSWLSHITSLQKIELSELRETLLWRSLFSEKRLIIIEDFPFSTEKIFAWATEFEAFLLDQLEKIPDENIVIFASISPDKRWASYKKLQKIAVLKLFNIQNTDDAKQLLTKVYHDSIETRTLSELLNYTWGNYEQARSEIEKLLLTRNSISLEDIKKFVIPTFDVSIFLFIDAILEKNTQKIFEYLDILLDNSNYYALTQSLLGNLRTHIYIELLKWKKIPIREIGDMLWLWNKAFLVGKTHKASYQELKILFYDILKLDTDMKQGKLYSSDIEDMNHELKALFLRYTQN